MTDYDELKCKRGRFVLKETEVSANIELWRLIMSNVFVVHCDYYLLSRTFHYSAFSELFDKLPPNDHPPDYVFSIDDNNNLRAIRE